MKKSHAYLSLLAAATMLGGAGLHRGFTYDEPRARVVKSNRGRKAQAKAAMSTKERVEARRRKP